MRLRIAAVTTGLMATTVVATLGLSFATGVPRPLEVVVPVDAPRPDPAPACAVPGTANG
jgi:hypothetical protein